MKVLVINVGTDPIQTERFEFSMAERGQAKQKVLETMNKMGKNSEAIVGLNGELFLYSHTSARGPSKELYRTKITYHPLSGQVR